MKIEQVKEEFSGYEYSSFFIECVYEALKVKKPSQINWFIKNHFMQYQTCDYDLMRKCGAHWNNVAFDKLNNFDFQNFESAEENNVDVSAHRSSGNKNLSPS